MIDVPLWQEIQDAIYYGGAVAAEILSPAHEHYRVGGASLDGGGLDTPGAGVDPSTGPVLVPGNRILPDLPFLADRIGGNFDFRTPNSYGKPAWKVLVDGSAVEVGDYLRGPSGTWFITAKQPLLPIMVVHCNVIVSLLRPGVADPQYLGDVQAEEIVLFSGWPCSILQGTKGEAPDTGMPADTRVPWFSVLLPAVPGVIIRHADFIIDDLNRRYQIASAEITDLGWRLTVCEKDV